MRLIDGDALEARIEELLAYVQQGEDVYYRGEEDALNVVLGVVHRMPEVKHEN